MTKLKMSPEELEAESLRFHVLREKRREEGEKAVAEMSKHPLSLEQMRAQIREHQAEAGNRLETAFAKREQRKNSSRRA